MRRTCLGLAMLVLPTFGTAVAGAGPPPTFGPTTTLTSGRARADFVAVGDFFACDPAFTGGVFVAP